MKKILNNFAFYAIFPIFFQLLLILIFFHIHEKMISGIFFLLISVVSYYLIFFIFIPRNIDFSALISRVKYSCANKNKLFFIFIMLLIVLMGAADILFNGFKLLDPLSYADLEGSGRYIRHISALSWILVPGAYFFIKSKRIRVFIYVYSVVFPILIVDRNRLLLTIYEIFFIFTFVGSGLSAKKTVLYFVFCILIFTGVGFYRSGHDTFIIESSGNRLVYEMLPLRSIFYKLPSFLQQLILYLTTPIFNFATIFSLDFINTDFLMSQISPFSRDQFDKYPYAPILVDRFNVGTEFFPWLTYYGVGGVLFAVGFMLISLIITMLFFKKHSNIFTLLIFLKVSYSVLMMGFAPQFYILLNFGIILLILLLWLFCSIKINSKIKYE